MRNFSPSVRTNTSPHVTGKKSFFQNMRAINAWKEAGVVCSDAGKAWERECGRGFCDDKHFFTGKCFFFNPRPYAVNDHPPVLAQEMMVIESGENPTRMLTWKTTVFHHSLHQPHPASCLSWKDEDNPGYSQVDV
jgi:hypothetical protein